jgi:hypothetical protein
MSGANGLFIPTFQVLEVDSEADGNDNIQNGAPGRPIVVRVDMIAQLPQRDKNEKNNGGRNKDLMGGNEPHTRL